MNELELINMNDKYETKEGWPVKILAIDCKNKRYPVVALKDIDGFEHVVIYTKYGGYLVEEPTNKDLVKVSPYKHWEIDCKVFAKESCEEKWNRRHYAGLNESGEPTTWASGKTSWSNHHDVDMRTEWDEMKLAEGNEDETVQDD